MKEIKSQKFIKKESDFGRYWDMNLPPGITERDIPEGPEENRNRRDGFTEVPNYTLYYTYEYDFNEGLAHDIKVYKVKDDEGRIIEDKGEMESFGDIFEDEIRDDIEELVADEKIPYSEDPYDIQQDDKLMGD